MDSGEWLTAEEAAGTLGVRMQTLYAYVSRGRIRAQAAVDDPRRSVYRAADVSALKSRNTRSRKAAEIAAGAIAWGEPVLTSGISRVAEGKLFYRGYDVASLAETEQFEAVAALLRGTAPSLVSSHERGGSFEGTLRCRLFRAVAARAGGDPPLIGRSAEALAPEADELLSGLADAAAGGRYRGPIARRLAAGWRHPPDGEATDLIRRALVLLADHELNASTFAARVTASTGASLAACVLAGLSALSGPRHGNATAALISLASEAAARGAERAILDRLSEGRSLPGFGHPLYPEGDPRARALLPHCETPAALWELQHTAETVTGLKPNVDFALVALCASLGLPEGAPFALFAVGRCAGWLAHAIEQAQDPGVIRPRARYAGPETGISFGASARI